MYLTHFTSPVNVRYWVRGEGPGVGLSRFAPICSGRICKYRWRPVPGIRREGHNQNEYSRLEVVRSCWHRGDFVALQVDEARMSTYTGLRKQSDKSRIQSVL